MRVSVGFGGQCTARIFLLVDRNVARNPAQDLAPVVSKHGKNLNKLFKMEIGNHNKKNMRLKS